MAETIEHRSGRMSFGKFNKVLEVCMALPREGVITID